MSCRSACERWNGGGSKGPGRHSSRLAGRLATGAATSTPGWTSNGEPGVREELANDPEGHFFVLEPMESMLHGAASHEVVK
jgi:hypothetical protein